MRTESRSPTTADRHSHAKKATHHGHLFLGCPSFGITEFTVSIPVNDQLLLPFLREGHARTHRSRLDTEALLIWGMVSDAALSSRSALGTCAVSPLLANWSAPVPLAEACLLALWITILSAAVPKKERVPHEGRLEGIRQETTQNQYTFSEGGGLGGRGEQINKMSQ